MESSNDARKDRRSNALAMIGTDCHGASGFLPDRNVEPGSRDGGFRKSANHAIPRLQLEFLTTRRAPHQ